MIQHSSSQGTVKADIVLKMAVVLLIYFWIPKKHFAKIAISMLSIRTFVPRWNCYPGLNITNASIFLSSVGASSDVSHLHHPMHPHLSQDPLTGQTILLGPMSTLVHTDQICKYPRCFSTVICLNYLRERGNLGKESISAPKLQNLDKISSPGLSCGRLWYSANCLVSLDMPLFPQMEMWVPNSFSFVGLKPKRICSRF